MRGDRVLKFSHFLLILGVVLFWGMNFVVIHVGLKGFPPLLLCVGRFGLVAFPWVFFLPRPKAPLKFILGYGVFTFAIQFALLFTGMHLGLSAGLASLVAQTQVFFSIALAAVAFKDKPSPWKLLGALISFVGIGIVAFHIGGDASLMGLMLTLMGAFAWASGNMFSKKVQAESPLALVAWGSLVALPIVMALSLILEGPTLILASLQNISWATVGAIFYIAYLSTHVGYGAWGYLLNKYPTAVIAPFTLLVPVVGFLSSAFFLGEALPTWKLVASVFVMVGLAFNLLEKQLRSFLAEH